jgi:hypothetical protein
MGFDVLVHVSDLARKLGNLLPDATPAGAPSVELATILQSHGQGVRAAAQRAGVVGLSLIPGEAASVLVL